MEIEFSRHALDQLKIRTRITKGMVLDTLQHSDNVLKSYRGRQLYRKSYGEEYLEVVARKEDNKLVVITAYILEE